MASVFQNFYYAPEVTYTDESNSYSVNKLYYCDCKNCIFFKAKNFRKEFFYGILLPLLWLVPGAAYIWKYIVEGDKCQMKLVSETELPTAFELREYGKNNFFSFQLQINDIEEINGVSDDGQLAVPSFLAKDREQDYAFYCLKQACQSVCTFHEAIKKDAMLWAGRGFSAFFLYMTLLAMLIFSASYSYNKKTYYK